MLNLNAIMVGTTQPQVLTEFYNKVFDKAPDMVDEEGSGWQVGSAFFTLLKHSEMDGKTKDPGRIMVVLETTQVAEEFKRIAAIPGAISIKEPYEMGGMQIATVADPDGNYFQLMSPWNG